MTVGGASPTGSVPKPVFDHLDRLSDDRGLLEHARFSVPRREHGYCVDDVARGLVVLCREPHPSQQVRRLAKSYLNFVLAAIDSTGACRNRMSPDGEWLDQPDVGDWWGRSLWALGAASVSAETPGMRARALVAFRLAAQQRSPHPRSMTFAGLGAAELLRLRPEDAIATALLRDAAAIFGDPSDDPEWPWPEERLSYANAAVAEMLLLAGEQLEDQQTFEYGLQLLEFLIDVETRDGHLSVTPVGGRGPGDSRVGFDQQPIEVAALADACATAYRITRDQPWLANITMAWAWFLGDNDSATAMFDPLSGAGYDGLEAKGCNRNQGAESTLAMLSTAQHARRISGLV